MWETLDGIGMRRIRKFSGWYSWYEYVDAVHFWNVRLDRFI
jgi:hypothetical protein